MEEIAARAGVGKATVYRRWPSRGALALDAFFTEFQEQQPVPDTGSFRGDMLAALGGWMRSVTRTPAGRMLAGLIAEAQRDPALAAAWRERVLEPLRARNTILLDRAISRGEIPADVDKDVVLDLLFGSAYHRLLNGHRPLTDGFARQVVDLIVAGVPAPWPPGRYPPVHQARVKEPIMTDDRIDPAVRALIAAVNDGDRAAVFDALTGQA